MKRILFLIFIIAGAFFEAYSQQDPQFSYYMNNRLYYNPAYSGAENLTSINLLHRSQWSFYQSSFDDGSAPQTQVFTLSSPIYKLNSGFGAVVVHDQLGAQNNLMAQGSYAYHLGLGESKLSVGLRFGFFSQSINWDQYRFIQDGDPILEDRSGRESQIRPDMAAGIYYSHEDYYAGISFNHLLRSSFDFGINENRNRLANHMYITGGYYYNISTAARVHSSMLVQTDFNQYNFTLGAILTMLERNKEKMWVGLTFRQAEDIGVLLGYHFLEDKSLKVGYSFGYVISNQSAKTATSHEFMINYRLPPIGIPDKKQQATPRFRH